MKTHFTRDLALLGVMSALGSTLFAQEALKVSGARPDATAAIWTASSDAPKCESPFTNSLPSYILLTNGNSTFFTISRQFPRSPQAISVAAMNKKQTPWAVVVACADSRVAPEILFNETLGNLFVVRNAGNVVDPVTIGSIEYALLHFHIQTVLILGHDTCGAVQASAEVWHDNKSPADLCGSIGSIVNRILPGMTNDPALIRLKDEPTNVDLLRLAGYRNAYQQAVALARGSSIVRKGAQIYYATTSMSTASGTNYTGQINIVPAVNPPVYSPLGKPGAAQGGE
jgi:carbonic anhydrase